MSFGGEPMELSNWRDRGEPLKSGSGKEAELQYTCTNAG